MLLQHFIQFAVLMLLAKAYASGRTSDFNSTNYQTLILGSSKKLKHLARLGPD